MGSMIETIREKRGHDKCMLPLGEGGESMVTGSVQIVKSVHKIMKILCNEGVINGISGAKKVSGNLVSGPWKQAKM